MKPERAWFLSEGEESDLGGGTASRSPFQRLRCLPFSDASKHPATKGPCPLGTPRCFADGKAAKAEWELVFLAGENQRATNPQTSPLMNIYRGIADTSAKKEIQRFLLNE